MKENQQLYYVRLCGRVYVLVDTFCTSLYMWVHVCVKLLWLDHMFICMFFKLLWLNHMLICIFESWLDHICLEFYD